MSGNFIQLVICVLLLAACSESKDESRTQTSSTEKKSQFENNPDWIGNWERNEAFAGATLEIRSFREDSLEFYIVASSGAHTGEIDGYAKIKNNKATYILKDEYGDDCHISFELKGDSVIYLEQSGDCLAGMGVTYTGRYVNKNQIKEGDIKENTLTGQGIFKNSESEEAFKNLVGEDYKLFINSSQITYEDSDIDSLRAKVFTSGVRGMYTYMENIILLDSMQNIWAAVIDDDKVYYYTNRKDYIETLPATIENWRERFKDKEVIYKSK